jgi:NADH:ubiquinone oxidoreductase subunit D
MSLLNTQQFARSCDLPDAVAAMSNSYDLVFGEVDR